MKDDIVIDYEFMGRFGNNVLQIWKTFLYCTMHDVSFDCISFSNFNVYTNASDFFLNIKKNFQSDKRVSNDRLVLENACRNDLKTINPDKDILFKNYCWIYPESNEEYKLFGDLFINKTYIKYVQDKYNALFNDVTTTVGMTIRRGDFLSLSSHYSLNNHQIIDLFNTVKNLYKYSSRLIVDSDDIPHVKRLLEESQIDMSNIVFLENVPVPETLIVLSLCSNVISNSRFWLEDYKERVYESTYGQIAQCLNRAYKFVI